MKSQATLIQDRLIAGSNGSLDAERDVFLVGPTGTGKSRQFSVIAADRVARDEHVIVMTHRQNLVLQAIKNMKKWVDRPIEISIGIDGSIDQSGEVVYSTIQTAHHKRDELGRYDVAIIDEAHHATSKNIEYRETMAALIERNPDIRFVAASATPPPEYRGMEPRLAAADKHIMTFEEAVSAKLIDLPVTHMPSLVTANHDNVAAVVRRHQTKSTSAALESGIGKDLAAMRGPDWSEQLVSLYERKMEDRRTLAFFDTIREAKAFMEEAVGRGHAPEIVHSGRSLKQNEKSLEDFREGRSKLLVSVDMINEGVDLDATAILLDKKTTSAQEYKQIIGRESRSHGTDRALQAVLYDTGASTCMHGEIFAQAQMQTIRGGIERKSLTDEQLLPDMKGKGAKAWIQLISPTTKKEVYATSIDGAIVYASRSGDGYATMKSTKDRKGARVDLLQIEGERKGMPSRVGFGKWVSEAVRRNEEKLSRLVSPARSGTSELARMVGEDWGRNAASIERSMGMMAASMPHAAAMQQAMSI